MKILFALGVICLIADLSPLVSDAKAQLAPSMFITNPAPAIADSFGSSVAGVGSNRFVVGAHGDSAGASAVGSAYLYDLNGTLLVTITNPAPLFGDYFGWSVAGVGSDHFVVGAFGDSAGADDAGSAYLYDLNGTLLATITNPAPAGSDHFGRSVAGVSSNRFVVGAPLDDAGAGNAGSAYLYDLNGTPLATITNPAPAGNDDFGRSVAGVGSNRFVVGAPLDDAGANNAGSAYLYDQNGTLLTTIINPTPTASDYFGYSVARVGSYRFAVGAVLDDAGAGAAGRVYLYDLAGTLLVTITNPAPAESDWFGFSVAGVGSNRLVVGAFYDDAGASNSGTAYLYDLDGTLLATINNPEPAAGDYFGNCVAGVDSNRFVVGAVHDDPGAFDVGRAFLYILANDSTGYGAWANQNALVQGPEGDDDLDGSANLLEYVTGASPTNAASASPMSATRTNGVLALHFTRDTNASGVTLIVEGVYAATNNAPWAGIAWNSNGVWSGSTVTETGATNPVNVTVEDTAPATTNRFLRLRVTRP